MVIFLSRSNETRFFHVVKVIFEILVTAINMEMDAILAVTLGGTLMVGGRYYIGGTIIGAITIQTLTTTMYAVGVSSDRLPAIKAIVILLIITIQSEKFKEMFRKWKLKRAEAVSNKEASNA